MQTKPIEGQVVSRVVQALGKSPLFSAVKPENLTQIAMRGELEQYEPGETVVEEGAVSDALYFIMGGEVRVLVNER